MDYTNLFVTLAVGIIVGGIGGYYIGRGNKAETFVNDDERLKNEYLAKLREHLNSLSDGEINNEDVRKLLDVSDTTACRYLNDLENEGLIKQIGTDGPKVYYKKL